MSLQASEWGKAKKAGMGKIRNYLEDNELAPKFDDDGKVTRKARMTVLHNGIKIHDDFELKGDTAWHRPPQYKKHAAKLPISLQNHGNPVKFRNIWIEELE